jgi:hypothetical protein
MTVWYSLWSFGTYTFPVLVCLDQEKSGNPGSQGAVVIASASGTGLPDDLFSNQKSKFG